MSGLDIGAAVALMGMSGPKPKPAVAPTPAGAA